MDDIKTLLKSSLVTAIISVVLISLIGFVPPLLSYFKGEMPSFLQREGTAYLYIIMMALTYILPVFIGVFSLWLYRRYGGRLNPASFFAIIFLTVFFYEVLGSVLGIIVGIVMVVFYPWSAHLGGMGYVFGLMSLPVILIYAVVGAILGFFIYSFLNIVFAAICLWFILDPQEKKAFGGEKTVKIISSVAGGLVVLAVVFVVVAGYFMYSYATQPRSPRGQGVSGFGAVKPIDHVSSGSGNLEVVFMNAVGSTIDLNVSVGGTTVAGGSVAAGDVETLSLSHPSICPVGVDSYDVKMNVTYINRITGLKHTSTGRVWGLC